MLNKWSPVNYCDKFNDSKSSVKVSSQLHTGGQFFLDTEWMIPSVYTMLKRFAFNIAPIVTSLVGFCTISSTTFLKARNFSFVPSPSTSIKTIGTWVHILHHVALLTVAQIRVSVVGNKLTLAFKACLIVHHSNNTGISNTIWHHKCDGTIRIIIASRHFANVIDGFNLQLLLRCWQKFSATKFPDHHTIQPVALSHLHLSDLILPHRKPSTFTFVTNLHILLPPSIRHLALLFDSFNDPGGMAGTVWLEEAVSVWKVVDCVKVDLLHPRRKWVVWLWCGECHRRAVGIVCGLGRNFLENWRTAVMGVFWPLSFCPASCPLNAHFWL